MVFGMRRALSCCCLTGDQTDSHQITYPSDPMLDERVGGPPVLLPSNSSGQMGKLPPGSLGPSSYWSDTGQTTSRGPQSSRSAVSAELSARSGMSPEERVRERERLQDMVKEFAKAVVQGQQCQWLHSTVGAPRAATYSFDKALNTFSLRPEESPAISVEMIRIRDVLKDVRDTPFSDLLDLPRPHALAGMELDRRFVCIVHEDVACAEQVQYIGLLLPNPYERERFYKCMKILRWALESRRERP
mmetsp:Transcript_114567/g.356801  ORF Transcript_114567/g.356801 Transcript_114567/m.356801 type:complete len:245 (-) Transcript_114567:73-807(-)